MGYFTTVADHTAGKWLGYMISFAAITSQLGQANGGSLIADEALQSFAVRHYEAFFKRKPHIRMTSTISHRNVLQVRRARDRR